MCTYQGGEKNGEGGVIYNGKLWVHSQAEQEVKFWGNLYWAGELGGGSDKFSSFSVRIKDDD